MRKLSKREALFRRKLKAERLFQKNIKYCINNGIRIYPECIVDKAKWRMVIAFVNDEGNITEIKRSDEQKKPVYYTSRAAYEIKHKELLAFYAKSS